MGEKKASWPKDIVNLFDGKPGKGSIKIDATKNPPTIDLKVGDKAYSDCPPVPACVLVTGGSSEVQGNETGSPFMPTPSPAARRLIPLVRLLAVVVLAGVEVSRWLHDHRAAEEREEAQERRMRPVRWRLYVVGIAVVQLALGNITLVLIPVWFFLDSQNSGVIIGSSGSFKRAGLVKVPYRCNSVGGMQWRSGVCASANTANTNNGFWTKGESTSHGTS